MNIHKIAEEILKGKVSADLILNEVKSIHHKPEDFEDGDLVQRIYKYQFYILKTIPIIKLDLEEWEVDESIVFKLEKQMKFFPIVITPSYSIIDGIHRANAQNNLGYKMIEVYIGTKK